MSSVELLTHFPADYMSFEDKCKQLFDLADSFDKVYKQKFSVQILRDFWLHTTKDCLRFLWTFIEELRKTNDNHAEW